MGKMGRFVGFVIALTGIAATAMGDALSTQTADEVVVTASRREAKVFDSPYGISVISSDEIQSRQMSRTVPDILSEEPAVMVQKTSYGQGSPYLRGFTGFRNVFLIDGIRLNNSTFREGPNQYWNTVDTFTVARLEMVKGPASVLYGSDAIGGAVNVISRDGKISLYPPLLRGESKGGLIHPRLYSRYSSANKSDVLRAEITGNKTEQVNFIIGGSLKDFNDLRGGKEVGLQEKTGYQDNSGDVRAEYALTKDSMLTLAHQNVRQADAWRTHRTIYGVAWQGTAVGTDKKHSFDQGRQLTYLQYETKSPFTFSERIKASLSYQTQTEDQITIKKDNKTDKQGFDVRTTGLWVQSETPVYKFGRIVAGIEYYSDAVDSYLRKYNAAGALTNTEIQGPVADDAIYNLTGVFVQDELALTSKLDLTAGLRYTRAQARADKVRDPVTTTQIELSDSWNSTVGSARLLYRAGPNMNIYGGISQGFRAPNLSDLTRYDIAQSGQQEIPNTSLRPEKFVSYETGIKMRSEKWHTESSVFYTTINDMIMRYPTGAMVGSNYEVQKANIGDGFMQGCEVKADYRISPQWSLFSGVAYIRGEVDTYPASAQVKDREPMNKVQPLQGILGGRWNDASRKYWAEAFMKAADRQDRLSPEDRLDTQRIPPDGTPGYTVFNIRGGWQASDNVAITVGIENIGDRDYRIHGSGTNEPGRNFIIALNARF